MKRGQLRRIAKLEQMVRSHLRSKDELDEEFLNRLKGAARIKLMIVALLVLYGEPKITESLEAAWQRCRQCSEWRACLEQHPNFGEYGRDDNATPFIRRMAIYIGIYFREYFLPNLPGSSEKEKLELIFERAPPWLLYFTGADELAWLCSISIPNVSHLRQFMRNHSVGLFDVLPEGPFEYRLLPDGAVDLAYARKKEEFVLGTEGMTHRERKRTLKILGKG